MFSYSLLSLILTMKEDKKQKYVLFLINIDTFAEK